MKAASLRDIKAELDTQSQAFLLSLCLRLARFKKENKELLTYLLFEEGNEAGYIEAIKAEVDIGFLELNLKNFYIAKKNLRKILRAINRYIKYSGLKTTEASLLIYFCHSLNASGLQINRSTTLANMYASQVKKIKAAILTLHEDLQYDYQKELTLIEQ